MRTMVMIFFLLPMLSISQVHNDSLDHALFNMINKYREENRLQPIIWNNEIHKASNHHSNYSYISEECTHIEDKKNGTIALLKEPEDRINRYYGHKYRASLENVAYDSETTEELVNSIFNMWLTSLPHKRTMLFNQKKLFGGCCIITGDSGSYATLNILKL